MTGPPREIRVLNDAGIHFFRENLASLGGDPLAPAPRHLLEDDSFSAPLEPGGRIERWTFRDRHDAARHLGEALAGIPRSGLERMVGLWSWLSLRLFDQVCPP